MRIAAPRIARKRKAGQFIILRPSAECERIPLTIANAHPLEGWIEIIFQAMGVTTLRLAALDIGESVADLAGPLGHPTDVAFKGDVLCIGGGVGVAPLYPIVCALAAAGNRVTAILGARTADLVILQNDMRAVCAEVHVATDDGTLGQKGFTTDVVKRLVEAEGRRFAEAVVIGPSMMMKVTSKLTLSLGIPTIVSLNPIMIDGTGMCGGCRVSVHGETKFACVDGPEFDAAGIDWDTMLKRLGSFREFESQAKSDHECRIGRDA